MRASAKTALEYLANKNLLCIFNTAARRGQMGIGQINKRALLEALFDLKKKKSRGYLALNLSRRSLKVTQLERQTQTDFD
jgi:hypothetical protein